DGEWALRRIRPVSAHLPHPILGYGFHPGELSCADNRIHSSRKRTCAGPPCRNSPTDKQTTEYSHESTRDNPAILISQNQSLVDSNKRTSISRPMASITVE